MSAKPVQTGNTTQVVAPNGAAGRGPAPLNPERPPPLVGKYSKLLGKDCKGIAILYTADGVTVQVKVDDDDGKTVTKSLAEYKAERQKAAEPTDAQKAVAFKNKFELRLNKEFPKDGDVSSDEKIRAFMENLPFRERRALMMTQKQFSASYPNGFVQA
jgi:hypothetical protein